MRLSLKRASLLFLLLSLLIGCSPQASSISTETPAPPSLSTVTPPPLATTTPVNTAPGDEPHIIKAEACFYGSYALLSDGNLWSWGFSFDASSGLSWRPQEEEPHTYPKLLHSKVKDFGIAIIGNGYLIKQDGSLWTWYNLEELFDGTIHRVMDDVVQASASSFSTQDDRFRSLALTAEGKLYAWDTWKAEAQAFLIFEEVQQALCCRTSFMVLLQDGSVWSWGWNYNGQVGNGTKDEQEIPLQIFDPTYGITTIFSDAACCYARAKDGKFYA